MVRLLNEVYESNPWENVYVHRHLRLKLKDKLSSYVEGFNQSTPVQQKTVEDLFMLSVWMKDKELEFFPDTLEVIEAIDNGELSFAMKEYIEKLCIKMGGQ